MRGHKSLNTGMEGFSTVEMIILLAVLVVFLAGVVLLTAKVAIFDTARGGTSLYNESTMLLDRIGAMLKSGRAISLDEPVLVPTANTGRLMFAADLDGAGGNAKAMSSIAGVDVTGLEAVAVFRPSPRSKTMVTRVWGSSSGSERVVLTSLLDPTSTKAFAVEYIDEMGKSIDPRATDAGDRSVSAVKVTVKLKAGDESRSFTRLFRLEGPIPVIQISPDTGNLQ